ncbi:hypothetical protein [Nocardioides sp. HB32]
MACIAGSFAVPLTVAFVVLELVGKIDWSWLAITSPVLGTADLLLAALVFSAPKAIQAAGR